MYLKVQIDQEKSDLIEALKGNLNEFILSKRLKETAQDKYYGNKTDKRLPAHKFE